MMMVRRFWLYLAIKRISACTEPPSLEKRGRLLTTPKTLPLLSIPIAETLYVQIDCDAFLIAICFMVRLVMALSAEPSYHSL